MQAALNRGRIDQRDASHAMGKGGRSAERRIAGHAADLEGPLHGVTYAPWAKDQDPLEGKASGLWSFLRTAVNDAPVPQIKPRNDQIERDFAMLGGKVNYVRTYRTTDGGDTFTAIG